MTSKTSIDNYTYHAVKINAVTQVENTGNLISPAEQFIGYNAFNKVASVSEGDHTYFITYGPDEARKKSVMNFQNTPVYTRYYLGDYEKTVAGSNTTQVHYLDGGAMYVVENGTGNLYYTYKDHLGSLLEVTDNTGNIIAKQNFDAWGNRRNPVTWDYTSIAVTPAWLYRGFTGHEHLPEFGLINMNGRMYDPLLGRMLSPDNFVQKPDYSQSFNRYSYCINNSLKFTDPTGEFFLGTTITATWDFMTTILTKGGIDPWNTSADRREAWRSFDPSSEWSKTNKSFKIDIGNFKTDPNRTTSGRGLQLLSRWTWELPQTMLGNGVSHIRNLTGNVDNVEYYGGATLVNKEDPTAGERWGFALGPYINSLNVRADPSRDRLFRHEYGHTLQSRLVGPLYLTNVALPSLIGQAFDNVGINDHNREWYETQANRMSANYFRNHDPSALTISPLDDNNFPRWYDPNWYWLIAHPPVHFMWWLFF